MNYVNTFIHVAPDTTAKQAVVPVPKAGKKTIAVLEYETIGENPYTYTQEEVQFIVHCRRQGVPAEELDALRGELWKEFFAKPRACMRSSPLPKTFGWGLHFDSEGKVALVPVDGDDYARLADDQSIAQTYAMRRKRA